MGYQHFDFENEELGAGYHLPQGAGVEFEDDVFNEEVFLVVAVFGEEEILEDEEKRRLRAFGRRWGVP